MSSLGESQRQLGLVASFAQWCCVFLSFVVGGERVLELFGLNVAIDRDVRQAGFRGGNVSGPRSGSSV